MSVCLCLCVCYFTMTPSVIRKITTTTQKTWLHCRYWNECVSCNSHRYANIKKHKIYKQRTAKNRNHHFSRIQSQPTSFICNPSAHWWHTLTHTHIKFTKIALSSFGCFGVCFVAWMFHQFIELFWIKQKKAISISISMPICLH